MEGGFWRVERGGVQKGRKWEWGLSFEVRSSLIV